MLIQQQYHIRLNVTNNSFQRTSGEQYFCQDSMQWQLFFRKYISTIYEPLIPLYQTGGGEDSTFWLVNKAILENHNYWVSDFICQVFLNCLINNFNHCQQKNWLFYLHLSLECSLENKQWDFIKTSIIWKVTNTEILWYFLLNMWSAG